MNRLVIVQPMVIANVGATRGETADNLLTADPKEVWYAASNSSMTGTVQVDLGTPRLIDTVFLGFLRLAGDGSVWSITGGVASPYEVTLLPEGPLKVGDLAGRDSTISHALRFGAPTTVRYLRINLTQYSDAPLSVGVLIVGKAFLAALGQEWGAGRAVVDTGVATPLPAGGFSVVEGVRKSRFAWTFGDLTRDETDQLETIALALGETKPALVIEDIDRAAGLLARIRYGKFDRWKQFERRNLRQTRWEIGIEDWT